MLDSLACRFKSEAGELRTLDLSNMNLDNDGVRHVGACVRELSSVEMINLSDNKFSALGLHLFMEEVDTLHTVREFDVSNNGLMDESIPSFSSAHFSNLSVLRLCNAQIDEAVLTQFRSLKDLPLQELYLDNNRLGNSGLLLLLTMLAPNQSLEVLSLRNNNITDPGFTALCYHILMMSSVHRVDMRDNCIQQESTMQLVTNTNSQLQKAVIEFTPSSSYTPAPPFSHELIHDKQYKEACTSIQLLYLILCDNGLSPFPPLIPSELRFNTELESHRKIISKLLQQPSVLAQRIASLGEALRSAEEGDPLLELVVSNLPLLAAYLQVSPSFHATVSSCASPPSSPLLRAIASPQSFSPFVVKLGAELATTVGTVRRCGIVKVRLLSLLESVVKHGGLVASSILIALQINKTLLELLTSHPWSSILHNAVESFITNELTAASPSLVYDVLVNHDLQGFISSTLRCSQKESSIGFAGQLEKINSVIRSIKGPSGFVSFE